MIFQLCEDTFSFRGRSVSKENDRVAACTYLFIEEKGYCIGNWLPMCGVSKPHQRMSMCGSVVVGPYSQTGLA